MSKPRRIKWGMLALCIMHEDNNRGDFPTIRWLSAQVGLVPSAVHYHIRRMVREGLIIDDESGNMRRYHVSDYARIMAKGA